MCICKYDNETICWFTLDIREIRTSRQKKCALQKGYEWSVCVCDLNRQRERKMGCLSNAKARLDRKRDKSSERKNRQKIQIPKSGANGQWKRKSNNTSITN